MKTVENAYVFMYALAWVLWILKPEELFKPSGKMKVFSMQQSDQAGPIPIWLVLIMFTFLFLRNEMKT